MIGHGALRFYVMGERAVEEDSTSDEQKTMAQIVATAIERGAVGFSINRYENHRLPDGRPIPGTFASVRELELIGHEVGKRNALFQSVAMDWDHMRYVVDRAKPRKLFNSTLSGVRDDESGNRLRREVDELAQGRDVSGVAQVRGAGVILGFEAMVPFRGEAWNRLRELKLLDKVAAIQDEQLRQRLVDEVRESKRNWQDPEWVFCLGNDESPDHSMGDHNQLMRMAE